MSLELFTGAAIFGFGLMLGYFLRDQKPQTSITMDPTPKAQPQRNFLRPFKKTEKFKPKALDDDALFRIEKKEKTGLEQD